MERALAPWTAGLAALGVIGSSLAIIELPLVYAAILIPVLVAILLAAWGELRNVARDERMEQRLKELLSQAPRVPQPPPPPRGEVKVAGGGRISTSVSLFVFPPPESMRDYLRVERFLSTHRFRDEASRTNASTWLAAIRLQQPWISAQGPADAIEGRDRLRREVLEEPDRRLRKEVLEFFTRNLMDWPQRSALRTTAEAPRPQTQSPKTPASEFVESPRDALGTESPNQSEPDHAATSSTPPKANPARPGSSEAVLFHGSLEINGGEHEAIEFELEKGSVVYGFVRETSGQPFDFYIMDRRNYAEFCESRNSREILEEYDRTALEFRRTIPKSGVWVFVVDTFHKQNDREVVLEIRESAGG